MSLWESLRLSMRSLNANKLRSVLTMLGIIIGVGAVIALMSIGRGAQASIIASIQVNGTNLLYVSPGSSSSGGVAQGAGSATTLTLNDATAIANLDDAPAVAAVAPEYSTGAQLIYQGLNTRTRVTGVTPAYAAVRNVNIANGEWLTDANVTDKALVAVLGPTTAGNLFGDAEPVGQAIKVNGVSFRVIGVTAAKGGTGFGSQDDALFVPITTLETRLVNSGQFRGQTVVSNISVQVTDETQITAAISQIAEILRARHKITTGTDDFSITNQADILKSLTQTTDTLTLFLGGVAAISLVVGGIGIMNIMLVSVTERTREIGIRKAIGAKKNDILVQFLAEAVVLSLAGGLIGIALGWGASQLVSGISLGGSAIRTVVDPDTVLLATFFSTAIGLFFGIYPANRAASLRPIDALRYE
ncbi:MAG: ABC transporter permease [Chloroflexota bacterium]